MSPEGRKAFRSGIMWRVMVSIGNENDQVS